MLKFSPANAKLRRLQDKTGKRVYSLALLSGHSCPYAKECFAKVVIQNGKRKVKDGPDTRFRCYSASEEVLFTAVYNARKHNLDAIKACGNNVPKLVSLILESLPANAELIRVHDAGDFVSKAYMTAWFLAAKQRHNVTFYTYTKCIPFWLALRKLKPRNFVLTASFGGHRDDLIRRHRLRYSRVVFSEAEAERLKLEIDHDDSHAASVGKSFALLLHGVQPAGTEAAAALSALNGKGAYRR